MEMNIEQYFNLCSTHDWFYQYSDDHRVWEEGSRHAERIRYLASDNEAYEKIRQEFNNWLRGERDRPTLEEFVSHD